MKLIPSREEVARWVAWNLLPKAVIVWAFCKVVSIATTGRYSCQMVGELRAVEALQRYEAETA